MINGGRFRVGDKVIQLRNNYQTDVFNSDMGFVQAIDAVEHTLTVLVDGNPVIYDFPDIAELSHAYAITVHRSQGSEYPAIVIPVMTQHYLMLQRSLLYTAITRAKRLVILIGTTKAIAIAVHNDKVLRRCSALAWRLNDAMESR